MSELCRDLITERISHFLRVCVDCYISDNNFVVCHRGEVESVSLKCGIEIAYFYPFLCADKLNNADMIMKLFKTATFYEILDSIVLDYNRVLYEISVMKFLVPVLNT